MTPEGSVKNSICSYLEFRRDVFFWSQESVGQWDKKKKLFRKKNSKYQRNGIPDILCMIRVGTLPPIFIGLEVKAGKNKQTESQIQFEKDYKQFGGLYFVVRNVEETKNALEISIKAIKGSIPVRSI